MPDIALIEPARSDGWQSGAIAAQDAGWIRNTDRKLSDGLSVRNLLRHRMFALSVEFEGRYEDQAISICPARGEHVIGTVGSGTSSSSSVGTGTCGPVRVRHWRVTSGTRCHARRSGARGNVVTFTLNPNSVQASGQFPPDN
ncbi:hypothetical protein [Nocardia sp. NPDC049526]|uniref:hypothetical protein n=1 Tax=Nocardia sp. NPDC049526 TaxID=3364316 RepID=UPI0037B082DE